MQFATHGGTCPKWIMHRAFRTPEKILAQAAELPNGQKYFMLARTAPPLWSPTLAQSPDFAVTLGCEIHHARDVIYADEMDLSKRRGWMKLVLAVRFASGWNVPKGRIPQLVMNCVLTAPCGASVFTTLVQLRRWVESFRC